MRIFILIWMLVWALPCVADIATVIEGARVNLRSGRADTYRIIKSLEPGTHVEILHDENGYVHVKTTAGDVGWLPMRMLKIEAPLPVRSTVDPQLAVLQAELEKARAELLQSPNAQKKGSSWMLLSLALSGLILGVALGIGGLQTYYQRRLKGLRI